MSGARRTILAEGRCGSALSSGWLLVADPWGCNAKVMSLDLHVYGSICKELQPQIRTTKWFPQQPTRCLGIVWGRPRTWHPIFQGRLTGEGSMASCGGRCHSASPCGIGLTFSSLVWHTWFESASRCRQWFGSFISLILHPVRTRGVKQHGGTLLLTPHAFSAHS